MLIVCWLMVSLVPLVRALTGGCSWRVNMGLTAAAPTSRAALTIRAGSTTGAVPARRAGLTRRAAPTRRAGPTRSAVVTRVSYSQAAIAVYIVCRSFARIWDELVG